jgi:hypothetical protein
MKIFFDTEFTGLHRETTLISIGLISENGDKFYAELDDYDKSGVDDWIQENVINNLMYNGEIFEWDYPNWFYYGDSKFIREKLLKWLEEFDTIEWVSDVCHYDFVLLIDLLYGHALNMPYGKHNGACHDINQDLAEWYGVDEIYAFDINRETILEVNGIKVDGVKHNALYDAMVIKSIYENVLN